MSIKLYYHKLFKLPLKSIQLNFVSLQVTQRAGHPVFEIVIELRPNTFHKWRVITDVAAAMDAVLQGLPFRAHYRERDQDSGVLSMREVMVDLNEIDSKWP